jgi:hypothetical protein
MQRQMHRRVPNAWPWIQSPPPAPSFEGALTPGPRMSPWTGHDFLYRQQPNPGAPAFAFQTYGLVEFTPIGAGDSNRRQLKPESAAGIVQFANLGLQTSGLGGLAQGQFALSPLIVPGFLQLDVGGTETPFAVS